MSSKIAWFNQRSIRELFTPGKILPTSEPHPGQWKILEILEDEDHQMEQADVRGGAKSYATLKLVCAKAADPSIQARMRVYLQVPAAGTETEQSSIRARQATTFEPEELRAYRIISMEESVSKFTPKLLGFHKARQNDSELVPGGFIIFIVWEFVPGQPLDDGSGEASAFWDLDRPTRDKVRKLFKESFLSTTRKLGKLRVWPGSHGPHNLVWNGKTQTLYWVRFRELEENDPPSWSDIWFPCYGLVKAPLDDEWDDPNWNGDTSRWEY
ncbi:uncharacterized protein N7459_005871 [Penicillium hispanicum]|uniref:uncharacterized protein n=1 Tax=Penicillium hispanicum TaxID=1080232 RepID=UPI0025420FD8|nr:uncharacterized protein N7459_005871 [Penicillium hispanicum]KAJ5579886.1 hypothetical protein N7459_005871 [Penicillium hispanicum]